MRVDFHTHFYTEAYLRELEKGNLQAELIKDQSGQRRIVFAGDYSLILPAHVDAAAAIAAMDANGVDRQLLLFSVPGLQVEKPVQGVRLAKIVNDALAEAVAFYPHRLSALAALPLQDPEAAERELERAVVNLGLSGGLLFSNINGRLLSHPSFYPLYAAAQSLDVPLFIHPISPTNIDGMRDFRLVPMAGFLFDTTLAALNLVLNGVMERFPKLKIVLGNLGGTIPYLAGRIDQGFLSYPEAREKLHQPPSTYLKKMYFETAGMPDAGALQLAIQFSGVDHLLLGSDYPQQIGDVAKSIRMVENLPIGQAGIEKILGLNASHLLDRKRR